MAEIWESSATRESAGIACDFVGTAISIGAFAAQPVDSDLQIHCCGPVFKIMDDRLNGSGISRRRFQSLLTQWLPAALSGCGTLMYPERRGQGRGGEIDWTVAGLDAIGLVFFFVPGLIAFGVDYYNGSLFFPESGGTAAAGRLKRVPLPGSHPSKEQIAQAISAASGKQITLQDGTFVTRRLEALDDFWPTHQQLLAQVEQGKLEIRCQSPSL